MIIAPFLQEADAVRKDLDMIDEQIEMWKQMNELEKKKEVLVAEARARAAAAPKDQPMDEATAEDDDDDSDEDGDFDVFKMDWRARKV